MDDPILSMSEVVFKAGLGDLEDNFGSEYKDGRMKWIRKFISEEKIASDEWEQIVKHLIYNNSWLPRIKEMKDATIYIRKGNSDDKRIGITCPRCNPFGLDDHGGWLWTLSDLWDSLGRFVIPCGCANTPRGNESPCFNELTSDDGPFEPEWFDNHLHSLHYENQIMARERKWEEIKRIHAKGNWVPKWMAKHIDSGMPGIPNSPTEIKAQEEIESAAASVSKNFEL